MNKKEEPGYGRWLRLGATTTWEQWSEEGSHNHPMFGGGLVWYYRKLAGMNADPDEPGYRHIIFLPQPVEELAFAKYFNQTPYGEAGIHWENQNRQFALQVVVPVGCRATVYVPLLSEKKIWENGQPVDRSKDVRLLKEEEGYRVFAVSSGHYQFLSK